MLLPAPEPSATSAGRLASCLLGCVNIKRLPNGSNGNNRHLWQLTRQECFVLACLCCRRLEVPKYKCNGVFKLKVPSPTAVMLWVAAGTNLRPAVNINYKHKLLGKTLNTRTYK